VFARLRERLHMYERERDALILSRFHGRRTFVRRGKKKGISSMRGSRFVLSNKKT